MKFLDAGILLSFNYLKIQQEKERIHNTKIAAVLWKNLKGLPNTTSSLALFGIPARCNFYLTFWLQMRTKKSLLKYKKNK